MSGKFFSSAHMLSCQQTGAAASQYAVRKMRCVLCSRDFCIRALICSISSVANIRSAALCPPEFRCLNIFDNFKTPADLTSNDLWLLLRHLS